MSNLFSSRSVLAKVMLAFAKGLARPRAMMAALLVCLAMVLTVAPVTESAARLGSGFSFGNRGTRTYSVPPSTATAPRPSALPGTGGFNQNGFAQQRPGGFFSGGGFGRGLLGGLVGAGLFGMLFGSGFGGGLGGGASVIGLILQLGLLYLAFRWIMGYFRGQRPAFGGASFGQSTSFRTGASGFGGGAPATMPIQINAADYAAFEQRLTDTQAAYSAGDMGALQRFATPEMASHFAGELANNNRQGVVNTLSNVKLLQGDLSEAWREGSTDYATVAMRFSLIDAMIDRASGRIVDGNTTTPQVVTEIWTFARPAGASPSAWVLSAIQQA